MKKNLTRLCCLLLALVMALGMAACGKSEDAPAAASDGGAKKPAATATPPSLRRCWRNPRTG